MANCRNHKPLVELLDGAIKQVLPDKRKNELRILDVGAGTGLVGMALQKLGFTTVDALDISQGMLNEARKKGVYDKFICAYLTEKQIAEIATGEYDAMVCNGSLTLGHVGPSAFVEMIRMVKTGKARFSYAAEMLATSPPLPLLFGQEFTFHFPSFSSR